MAVDLLCLDADDTLWHNMRHFDAVERAFSAMMAPFSAEAEAVARDRLEAVSSVNLRLYAVARRASRFR